MATGVIAKLGDPGYRALLALIAEPGGVSKRDLLFGLRHITSPRALRPLEQLADSTDPEVAEGAREGVYWLRERLSLR